MVAVGVGVRAVVALGADLAVQFLEDAVRDAILDGRPPARGAPAAIISCTARRRRRGRERRDAVDGVGHAVAGTALQYDEGTGEEGRGVGGMGGGEVGQAGEGEGASFVATAGIVALAAMPGVHVIVVAAVAGGGVADEFLRLHLVLELFFRSKGSMNFASAFVRDCAYACNQHAMPLVKSDVLPREMHWPIDRWWWWRGRHAHHLSKPCHCFSSLLRECDVCVNEGKHFGVDCENGRNCSHVTSHEDISSENRSK